MPQEQNETTTPTPTTEANTPAPPAPSPHSQGQLPTERPSTGPTQAEYDAQQAELTRLRARAQRLEQEAEAARQAELSELERERERAEAAERERATLQAQLDDRRRADAVWESALAEGVSPARRAALLRLVDLSDVVLVEGGGVQGVETVLERARNLAPEFFAGSVTTTSTTQTQQRPSERSSPTPQSDYEKGRQGMKQFNERSQATQGKKRQRRL